MDFEDNEYTSEIATDVRNSFNTTTTNNANLNVGLENVGNETTDVSDSGNTTVGVDGSFHNGSHNQDWDIDDSGNTGSYNTAVDIDITDASQTDNSVNAGVRDYSTGFAGTAGFGDVTGDVMVNNQNTIVDQSLNANVLAGGDVSQYAKAESVVASGDGAMAAGGDIDIEQTVYRGTEIDAGGDVLIDGSSKDVNVSIGSGNTTTTNVTVNDSSQDWDLDNVGNEYSATLGINNSFTETDTDVDYQDWDIDADVIWDSELAANTGDVDLDA